MLISPFEQFELQIFLPFSLGLFFNNPDTLSQLNLSFTNSTLYLAIGLFVFLFLTITTYQRNVLNSRSFFNTLFVTLYKLVMSIVISNIGSANIKYFPFIATIFIFISLLNLIGMVPYSFTVTSHISITFALAFSICVALFILGLYLHGLKFFKSFLPEGTPLALAPLLITIEFVSYLSHAISLSVRLFANMLSGHALLKILSGFVASLMSVGGVYIAVGFAPLMVVFILTGLEFCIAVLQAYVFTILTCIYLKDAIYPH